VADKIHVKGLADLQKGLRMIDNDLGPELRKGLNEVAEIVAADARRHVPTLTGKARGSISAGGSQRAAAIKMGGTKAPHMLWLEFGGRVGRDKSVVRPFIRGGRYVYPALARNQDEVMEKLDEVVGRLVKRAGFDTKET
jgi:hypothetical protein